MEQKEELLKQYLKLQLEYVKFQKYMVNLIDNLLIEKNIKYQNLTSRVKDVNSLEQKLNKSSVLEKLDGNIQNMYDLCGIRIVLYANRDTYQKQVTNKKEMFLVGVPKNIKLSIIKENFEKFKDINNLYIEKVLESRKIEENFIDYKENKEYMNKEEIIETFIEKNKIEKKEIGIEKKYLKEIAKKLKDKCGITHKEIAEEF